MTIVEFLLERIAEDEAVAGAASGGGWHVDNDTYAESIHNLHGLVIGGGRWGGEASVFETTEDAIHIARFDPMRIMAECKAKRAIVDFHQAWPVLVEQPEPLWDKPIISLDDVNAHTFYVQRKIGWFTQEEYRKKFGDEPPTAPLIAVIAAVYSDHPDYQEEWA